MLLVQQYLKEKSLGELARDHGVYASFSKSGHKFSLNYDQIEARESDPLAQECRGLILARKDGSVISGQATPEGRINRDDVVPGETTILAYPMKRFFNYGQGAAVEIDWSDPNLAVLEKLDGTLCIVYYDRFIKQWCVATRSVPEADLPLDGAKFTFRTLFEKALNDTLWWSFDEFTASLYKDATYCFELTTPYNRIVVNYPVIRITLLAMRNIQTLKEENIQEDHHLNVLGIPIVQAHTYTSVEALVDWVSSLNPMEHEGVVVRDSNFNRIKVKNAAYVAYNRARDVLGASDRNCIELILLEKEDDVLPAMPPEIQENLLSLKEKYRVWLREQDLLYKETYAEAQAIGPDKKTFAILTGKKGIKFSAAFFSMFDGKASCMKEFILNNKKQGTWGNGFLDKILESI